jgi:hypothetical protein
MHDGQLPLFAASRFSARHIAAAANVVVVNAPSALRTRDKGSVQ